MVRAKLGQNFLIDENIAKKIVNSLHPTTEDNIIEVGPGRGILTKYLIPRSKQLIAIELDRSLHELLADKFRNETGWEPEIPLEKTLEDMLNYWRDQLTKCPWKAVTVTK